MRYRHLIRIACIFPAALNLAVACGSSRTAVDVEGDANVRWSDALLGGSDTLDPTDIHTEEPGELTDALADLIPDTTSEAVDEPDLLDVVGPDDGLPPVDIEADHMDAAADSAPTDMDNDGVFDGEDNCPAVPNPDQENQDGDKHGDACDPDDDGDGVPDLADESPLDPSWPGLAIGGAIYAHTSSSLYQYDPQQSVVSTVGVFSFPNGGQSMTDIAIDYEGHIFGVSFGNLYRCSAVTAECIHLGGLPSSFNGMTILPVGTLDPGQESMIGIGNSGSWNEITVLGNQATITQLGSYGAGYTSAGDAYSIEGIGTFAAVNKVGSSSTYLVKVDPVVGTVMEEIGPMTGYTQIYGLASDGETAFAFDASGAILALDVDTGNTTVALPAGQGKSWWGAGVTTRYFSKN